MGRKKKETSDDFYNKWDTYANKRSAWIPYLITMQNVRLADEERKYQEAK